MALPPDPRRRVRMADVAARAGVSVTTVSFVLNGKADGSIPATTQARVHAAVAELGYRRNALAADLRRQTTDTIGFITDFVATTPYAGQMVQGAQETAWKAGKLLLMVSTQGDSEIEQAALDTVLSRRVDGIVFAPMFHQVVEVSPQLYEVPAVLLDATAEVPELSSVVPDEFGGAFDATTHLIEAGHRRLGYVQCMRDIPAARGRLDGFRRALQSAGLSFDPSMVVRTSGDVSDVDRIAALLTRPDRPTGLFCFNDKRAAGVARIARRLGLEIPRELSLVGFDNQELIAPLVEPPLTTMQLPHYDMGRWAVEHLLELIRDPQIEPVHHRMPCPLVPRVSVASPPG